MSSPTSQGTSVPFAPDSDLLQWLQSHSREVLIGVGALASVVAVGFLVLSSARRKEAFASQRLTNARAAAEAGNLPLASSDLSQIAEQFAGTRSADEAAILLAQIRLVQGQTDVAVNALQQFVTGRRPDYTKASAYGLLGGGLENQGRFRDAGAAYRQASAHSELDFLKATYLIDAGRALTFAGDTAGARASYGEVLSRFGELDQAAEARVRMAEVGGVVPRVPSPRREGRQGRPGA